MQSEQSVTEYTANHADKKDEIPCRMAMKNQYSINVL